MSRFSEIAKQETVLSELMQGRDKIETEDIIKYYPNGISINQAQEIKLETDGKTDRFWVYCFKEDNKKFAFSGLILTKIFDACVKDCEGDMELFAKELNDDPLVVVLSSDKTKDGKKQITKVEAK